MKRKIILKIMKQKKLILNIILLVIIGILLLIIFIDNNKIRECELEGYSENFSRQVKNIEKGNGIVINIWMDESEIEKLKEHNIKYLFLDIGDVDKKTGLVATPDEEIEYLADSIKKFEEDNNYDFVVLPWNVVIPEEGYEFDSETFRENLVDEYVRMVYQFDFDGVHMDVEAIPFGQARENYLDMLEELDRRLPDKLITLYSGSINDDGNIWEWDTVYFHEIAKRADLISTQGYDTGLTSESEYREYLRGQIEKFCSEEWGSTKFIFALPAHKSFPEMLDISIDEYETQIKKYPNCPFIGINVFAEWEMDDSEWGVVEGF